MSQKPLSVRIILLEVLSGDLFLFTTVPDVCSAGSDRHEHDGRMLPLEPQWQCDCGYGGHAAAGRQQGVQRDTVLHIVWRGNTPPAYSKC